MTTRSITNYRPKGDPDAAPYSPQRDLANIYTPMLKEAFMGLDQVNWADYFKDWLKATKVTEEDLGRGVQCFVEAHRLFIRDRTVKDPHTAFEKAGFWDLPAPVRILIFERIGEVVMGGFFVAIRDVSCQGRPSPIHTDFMEMIAAGRLVAGVLSQHRPRELDAEQLSIEKAIAELEEFKRIYTQLLAENEEIRKARYQAETMRDSFKLRAETAAPAYDWYVALPRAFFPKLWACVRLAWEGLPGRTKDAVGNAK